MFTWLTRWILNHQLLSGILAAIVILATTAGASQVRLDFSFQALIGSGDPAYGVLQDFLETWGGDDKTLFVVASVEEGDLLDPERLQQLDALIDDLEGLPEVTQVVGLPRAPADLGSTPGVLEVGPLIDSAPKDPTERKQWKKRVLQGDLVPVLLSKDARHSGLVIELNLDPDDLLSFQPTVGAIRTLLERENGQKGIVLQTAGIPAIRADLGQLMQQDMALFTAVGFVLMALFLFATFRSPHGVLLPMTIAVIPTAMVFGVMGWTGESIGLISQTYPILIPAIAIADAIHVLSRFHFEARKLLATGVEWNRETRHNAAIAAMGEVGIACLFTSLTTGIGFFSLLLADMSVLQSFGLYAGIGIVLAFFSMIIVMPLLLVRIQRIPKERASSSGESVVEDYLGRIARSGAARPLPRLVVGGAIALLALFLAQRVIVDNSLAEALPADHPSNRAAKIVDEHLGGVLGIYVDISASGDSTLLTPASLKAIDDVEKWGIENSVIRTVQGPAGLLRGLHKGISGEDALPKSPAVARELLFLIEGQPILSSLMIEDYQRARILMGVPDIGAKAALPTFEALQDEVEIAFEGAGASAKVTGVAMVAYQGFSRVAEELLVSLLSAFLFISLVIGFLFRSLRICLISLVPNVMPLLITLATMGLLGWNLEVNAAIIFTLALGLAVDDTIHLLTRISQERKRQSDSVAAIETSVKETGRALLVTTLALCAGFGVNLVSQFPSLQIMGVLGVVAIGSAFLCDLFLLPSLLVAFGGMAHGAEE